MLHIQASPSSATEMLDGRASRWGNGWWWVLLLLVPAVVLQQMSVICMCGFAGAKVLALLGADAAIAARAVAALLFNERSRGWSIYLLLYILLIPITLYVARLAGAH